MKHLIVNVSSTDEWAEYPKAFVLPLTRPILEKLQIFSDETKWIESREFMQAEFSFRCGIWLAGEEWLEEIGFDRYEEEFRYWVGYLPEDLAEMEGLDCHLVSADKDTVSFKCYGKYTNVEYFTQEFDPKELMEEYEKGDYSSTSRATTSTTSGESS